MSRPDPPQGVIARYDFDGIHIELGEAPSPIVGWTQTDPWKIWSAALGAGLVAFLFVGPFCVFFMVFPIVLGFLRSRSQAKRGPAFILRCGARELAIEDHRGHRTVLPLADIDTLELKQVGRERYILHVGTKTDIATLSGSRAHLTWLRETLGPEVVRGYRQPTGSEEDVPDELHRMRGREPEG